MVAGPEATPRNAGGFTLVEVMTAAAITGLVLVALFSLLHKSADVFAVGQTRADVFTEARASLDFLRKDLEAVIASRDLDLSPRVVADIGGSYIPPAVAIAAADPEGMKHPAHPLAKRYFVPFEVNRVHGTTYDQADLPTPISAGSSVPGGTKGFANAVSDASGQGYHRNYSALAFFTLSPLTRQVQTNLERGTAYLDQADAADAHFRNYGDVCVAGYYCAYTYDSPLPGARATMKLHRHFRDSGAFAAGTGGAAALADEVTDWWWIRMFDPSSRPVQSRSHVLALKLGKVCKTLYEKSVFDNATLPFLLKPVDPFGAAEGNLPVIEPFPVHPAPATPNRSGPVYDRSSLAAVPPPECYGTRDHWDASDIFFPDAGRADRLQRGAVPRGADEVSQRLAGGGRPQAPPGHRSEHGAGPLRSRRQCPPCVAGDPHPGPGRCGAHGGR